MDTKFYIGQRNAAGLRDNLKPYAIPDNAFSELLNAVVFRERVKKRFGGQLMRGTSTPFTGLEQLQSRLRMKVDTTDATTGDASGTVPGSVFAIGQAFSIDGNMYTVNTAGAVQNMLQTGDIVGVTDDSGNASGTLPGGKAINLQTFIIGYQTFTVPASDGALITTGTGSGTIVLSTGEFTFTGCQPNTNIQWFTITATYSTTNGAYNFVGAPAGIDVYFYPALPVMGISTFEQVGINQEKLVAFDTQYSYEYKASGFDVLPDAGGGDAGAGLWTGTNADYFWTENVLVNNATRYMFATNYKYGTTVSTSDQIRYLDSSLQWKYLGLPVFVSGGNTGIVTARCILYFKGKLLLFNVVEYDSSNNTVVYPNRVRWSRSIDPTDATAWYSGGSFGGGFLDATTSQAIVSVEFINDRIIVFFEASTWELIFTNNTLIPFLWQKINTELGAESTFSLIPFDKVVLGIGNVGIHSCNGVNVERIDQAIPNFVFNIHNDNSGPERVYGIRDYYSELVYWAIPEENRSDTFPYNNQVLVYNYNNNTWALYDDSINCFGYYQNILVSSPESLTWGDATMTWGEADMTWGQLGSISQSFFKNILAGNQEGYLFVVIEDKESNSPALQITDIPSWTDSEINIVCIDHNFTVGEYVRINNAQGITGLENQVFGIVSVIDQNNFSVLIKDNVNPVGIYFGGGVLTRVTPPSFKTKQFNFFAEDGVNAKINKVDFLVNNTQSNECTVDCYVNTTDIPTSFEAYLSGTDTSKLVLDMYPYAALYPYEVYQDLLWHPVYYMVTGQYVQFVFNYSYDQIAIKAISEQPFELHAMIITAAPSQMFL